VLERLYSRGVLSPGLDDYLPSRDDAGIARRLALVLGLVALAVVGVGFLAWALPQDVDTPPPVFTRLRVGMTSAAAERELGRPPDVLSVTRYYDASLVNRPRCNTSGTWTSSAVGAARRLAVIAGTRTSAFTSQPCSRRIRRPPRHPRRRLELSAAPAIA
jgi:hypothetical protein